MGQRSAAVHTFGSAQHAATHCWAVVMAAELMSCIPEQEAVQVWPPKELITQACFATPPAPVAGNTETLFEAAVATKAARATSFIMIVAPERGSEGVQAAAIDVGVGGRCVASNESMSVTLSHLLR